MKKPDMIDRAREAYLISKKIMLILKRLAVWLIETAAEAVLLSLFMNMWWGYSDPVNRGFLFQLFGWALTILTVFMLGSGYLITTAILRIAWKSQRLWTYSAASAVLVLVHLQIFFFVAGGWTIYKRLTVQVASACIVFACTFIGGWILQKAGYDTPSPQK
ncbi:MAG: hypothetical protein ACREA2_17185 [Blastocatellia bacterium]